jgi:hypothetical protein
MPDLKLVYHEFKLPIGALLIVVGLILMVLAIIGYPDDDADGDGPLAPLRGINLIVILLTIVLVLGGLYIVYKFISDKSRFEALMRSKSQAIFKRNQIEIERLALRLTSKEEKRVLEAIKKYRIR